MTKLSRRTFLGTTFATSALSGIVLRAPAAGAPRPNLLFILADDLGYGDLSCYGRPDYQTPVLDRFATQGIKFTSAYAAAPLCTPTRCALITGRYPQRLKVGAGGALTPDAAEIGLPPGHPTIATQLKAVGYETALFGKWHLGWKPEFGPNRHGYDEFFGILSGAADYFTHRAAGSPEGGPADAMWPDLWENLAPVQRVGYLTDLLSDRAVQFIGRKRSAPFLLNLHYNAPHSPWEGPEDSAIGHESHGSGPMMAGGSLDIYAHMMKSMDAGIGRVLTALRRAGLERNTLVIFTSDNGGARYSFNWPFSFGKGGLFEGGTRVPAIARWPGVIPAGRSTDQAAITMDWSATMLAVAGAQPDAAYPFDGDNLLPVLTATRAAYDRQLCWRINNLGAVRSGHIKYLREGKKESLFDLTIDPGEKNDLKAAQPARLAELSAAYDAWNAPMQPAIMQGAPA